MYPHERSLVKQLADKPFALIGVNSDRNRDRLKEVMNEKDITWRSFWNGPKGTSGPISVKWAVRGWPTIYIIDAEGIIRFKGARGAAMDEAVTELLAEINVEVEISHEDDDDEDDDKKSDKDDEKSDKDKKDKAKDDIGSR